MPDITYHRFWCHTCKDFTLFFNKKCRDCDTEATTYKLTDVPKEKILEQRQRYKEYKKEQTRRFFSFPFIATNPLFDLFSDQVGKHTIVETDAGQKAIDKAIQEKRGEEVKKRIAEREALQKEYLKFKHLGRNDLCVCGSGKKYKKCCLDKFVTL